MLERIGARRVLLIAALGVAVLVGAFAATNLASSTVYYLTPSEAKERGVAPGQVVRLGGLVKAGSLKCCLMYDGSGFAATRESTSPERVSRRSREIEQDQVVHSRSCRPSSSETRAVMKYA